MLGVRVCFVWSVWLWYVLWLWYTLNVLVLPEWKDDSNPSGKLGLVHGRGSELLIPSVMRKP
jgi:hypothetical protein